MNVRPMKPNETGVLVEASMRLAADQFERLRPSREKIAKLAQYAISNSACYVRAIADDSDEVQAILCSVVQNHVWAERKVGHIMVWHSFAPGAGAAIMRDYIKWFQSRRAIKMTGFSSDYTLPVPAKFLLMRLGFEREGDRIVMYN